MSNVCLNDMLNLNGATFVGCDFDGFSPRGAARSEGSTYCVPPGETLTLSGNCSNITIISDGGYVKVLNGTQLENCNIQGQRCTVQLGNDCTLNGMNARGTCFISLECGDGVNISNSDFSGAFVCTANFHGHTCFKNVNFCGAHLSPSFAGCSLLGCKIDRNTRCADANLHLTRSIVDLEYEGIGCLTNLEQAGLNPHPCSLSPRATLLQAGVGDACHTDNITLANTPNMKPEPGRVLA